VTGESAAAALPYLRETAELVGPFLRHAVSQIPEPMSEVIAHSLGPAGASERAALVRAAWELGGGPGVAIVPAAAAVELLHFSTLVIDDVLDDSDLRGGGPSTRALYGDSCAVLAGEVLHTEAILALAHQWTVAGYTAPGVLSAIRALCGAHRLQCTGAYADLRSEGQAAYTETGYLHVVRQTTGSLAEACMVIGATLRSAPQDELRALAAYGGALGVALQVRDDILDLVGDPELTGKELGGDLRRGKPRLPVIRALANLDGPARSWLADLIASRSAAPEDIDAAVRLIVDAGGVEQSIDEVGRRCGEARRSLSGLGACGALEFLDGLAVLVAESW